MKVILSPAKNMKKTATLPFSEPVYKDRALYINSTLKKYQPHELESLMRINTKIAINTFRMICDFEEECQCPAIESYDGIAFKNIRALDFTEEEKRFAHESIRILSGYYGILRAYDGIAPYRLDFESKIRLDKGSLYDYWGSSVYEALEKDIVINIASKEYSRLITDFTDNVINITFYDNRRGRLRTQATYAKMARGAMAGWIVRNFIEDPALLREFEFEGYGYAENLSSEKEFVFVRDIIDI